MAAVLRLSLLLPFLADAIRHRRNKRSADAGNKVSADVASNNSMQSGVCPFGMCYDSWGAYKKPQFAGVGGKGNRGCWKPFWGCPGSSDQADCLFGPCPNYFGTPACVSTSGCRSYCDERHAGSCGYTGPRESTGYSQWMSGFQSSPLNKLLMVSAHHTLARLGTLDFNNPVKDVKILKDIEWLQSVPGAGDIMNVATSSLLPMWSSTQSADVAHLLRAGVRAFDFRPYLSRSQNVIRDHHTARGPQVEPAMAHIANFARQQKTEIVFVNLKNILRDGGGCYDCKSASETYARINDAVRRHFGECGGGMLLCNVDVTRTVGELVQGGNVIVHSDDSELVAGSARRIHSDTGFYRATWYDKNSFDDLRNAVWRDGTSRHLAAHSNTLIGHQWILSPRTDDFVGAISQRHVGDFQDRANPHGCQSLACFAEVASGQSFKREMASIRAHYARSNFLMLDYADRAGTMDAVLLYNQRYAR